MNLKVFSPINQNIYADHFNYSTLNYLKYED